MSMQREPTIADVLTGHTQVTPLMKITAGQRLYYNYHFDQPSLGRETRCCPMREALTDLAAEWPPATTSQQGEG